MSRHHRHRRSSLPISLAVEVMTMPISERGWESQRYDVTQDSVRSALLELLDQVEDVIFVDDSVSNDVEASPFQVRDGSMVHIAHVFHLCTEWSTSKQCIKCTILKAIPIKDAMVLSKIHQTYKVGYLKNVVLARVLDEVTVANLNSVSHANNAIVVSLLKDDGTFIQELFGVFLA